MQASPRAPLSERQRPASARMSTSARMLEVGAARPSARPRLDENRQERFCVSPRMRPDELPKFGLQYHAKQSASNAVEPLWGRPERRPQSAALSRSPRSPRNGSPRAASLTTARATSPRGFEPAGFKQPWGGLPDSKQLPWMQYGAQCTMKQRPTSAHAANRAPAEFHKAEMKRFVDEANADGVISEAERLALTSAKERCAAWTKYTPEQLAEINKAKTLTSDIFHRKAINELHCMDPELYPTVNTFRLRKGDDRPIWNAVW